MNEEEFGAFYESMFPSLIRFGVRELDTPVAARAAVGTLRAVWVKNYPFPEDEQELQQLESVTFTIMQEHVRDVLRPTKHHFGKKKAEIQASGYNPDIAYRNIPDAKIAQGISTLDASERDILGWITDGYAVPEVAALLETSLTDAGKRLKQARDNFAAVVSGGLNPASDEVLLPRNMLSFVAQAQKLLMDATVPSLTPRFSQEELDSIKVLGDAGLTEIVATAKQPALSNYMGSSKVAEPVPAPPIAAPAPQTPAPTPQVAVEPAAAAPEKTPAAVYSPAPAAPEAPAAPGVVADPVEPTPELASKGKPKPSAVDASAIPDFEPPLVPPVSAAEQAAARLEAREERKMEHGEASGKGPTKKE
ncbi:MAG: hypothetical protein LBU38_02820, partial [Propionibacteriaceae bacterium]|nr:hypothetical protein [Propionibacteriaceae bacterium]